jgi:hypothetical protein
MEPAEIGEGRWSLAEIGEKRATGPGRYPRGVPSGLVERGARGGEGLRLPGRRGATGTAGSRGATGHRWENTVTGLGGEG